MRVCVVGPPEDESAVDTVGSQSGLQSLTLVAWEGLSASDSIAAGLSLGAITMWRAELSTGGSSSGFEQHN